MKNKWVFLGILCVAAISSGAFGSVTYQKWTFDDNDNPAVPEFDNNPYGDPTAAIETVKFSEGSTIAGSAGWRPGYAGRNGVWIGDVTTVTLVIPNSPVANPGSYKDIWLEMEFRGYFVKSAADYGIPDTDGMVSVSNGTVDTLSWAVTAAPANDGWSILQAHWRIEPNPQEETIFMALHDSGAYINYIAVTTDCVPEPATMLLLGLGGTVTWLRRKK